MDDAAKIFVGGIPQHCDESSVQAYFSGFGSVVHVEVKRDQETGNSRGFGFVTFDDPASVEAALAMNGQHNLDGKNVEVKAAQQKGSGGKDGKGKGKDTYGKGGGKGPSPGSYLALGNGWGGSQPSYAKGFGGGKDYGKGYASLGGGKAKGMDKGCKGKMKAAPWDMGKGKGGETKTFDRDDAKIFVGGLPKSATEESVAAYFGMIGPVTSVQMKMDPLTGGSRGFCFVTFEDAAVAAACTDITDHQIDEKWIEVKSAMVTGKPAPGQKGGAGAASTEPLKIFVGGLLKTTTEDQIITYFSEFGTVVEVLLKKDEAGVSKGFAFVSFVEEAAVASVLNNYANNQIDGKWVEVKTASAQQAGGKGDKGAKGGLFGPKGYSPKGYSFGPKGCAKGKNMYAPY